MAVPRSSGGGGIGSESGIGSHNRGSLHLVRILFPIMLWMLVQSRMLQHLPLESPSIPTCTTHNECIGWCEQRCDIRSSRRLERTSSTDVTSTSIGIGMGSFTTRRSLSSLTVTPRLGFFMIGITFTLDLDFTKSIPITIPISRSNKRRNRGGDARGSGLGKDRLWWWCYRSEGKSGKRRWRFISVRSNRNGSLSFLRLARASRNRSERRKGRRSHNQLKGDSRISPRLQPEKPR